MASNPLEAHDSLPERIHTHLVGRGLVSLAYSRTTPAESSPDFTGLDEGASKLFLAVAKMVARVSGIDHEKAISTISPTIES